MSRRPIPASTMTKTRGSDNVTAYRTPSNESTNSRMILPLHEQVRARVRDVLSPAAWPRPIPSWSSRSNTRPTARSAISARRSRSISRAACARRRALIAQELAGRARDRSRELRASRPRRTAISTFFSIARPSCCRASAWPARCRAAPGATDKTIVEHTAINPNKAAHIGHLRNSALGDTLVRVLTFRGNPVEVQNYIDDTGVQVADVVVGFRELEKLDARRCEAYRGVDAVRLLLLGFLRARHRVVRRRQGTAQGPRRDAARHRAWHRSDREPRARSSPTPWSART